MRIVSTSLGALVLASLLSGACATSTDDATLGDDADITSIPRSGVRDQAATGNCWLYATVAWAESLAVTADGKVPSYSTGYLVYWNFYEQILAAKSGFRGVEWTGGSWGRAAGLMARYGLMDLRAFTGRTAAGADAALSLDAMDAVNASLRSGALRTKGARSNGALVRRELDRAFGLSSELVANLDVVFGADGARTFESGAIASGKVLSPAAVRARLPGGAGETTLRDCIGDQIGDDADARSGPYAFQTVALDHEVAVRRRPGALKAFLRRVQRALHAAMPVPVAWCVEEAGQDDEGRFVSAVGGVQEGECAHETLIVDYEAVLADGTVLPAGEVATAAEMAAALEDDATVSFLRVKNSWGRDAGSSVAGYTDLSLAYLASSVRVCPEGAPSSEDCEDWAFMLDRVVLPPGF